MERDAGRMIGKNIQTTRKGKSIYRRLIYITVDFPPRLFPPEKIPLTFHSFNLERTHRNHSV